MNSGRLVEFGGRSKFSELGKNPNTVPAWAKYLISLGQSWPSNDASHRRIALVSMPCDSPAAGLIALGALTSDLCDESAHDQTGHYDALMRYANQYLNHCKSCRISKCDPSEIGCGYIGKVSGRLRSVDNSRKRYFISEKTNIEENQLWWELPGKGKNGPVRGFLGEANATQFYPDGSHPVTVGDSVEPLDIEIYQSLVSSREIFELNLRRSYSGLCLAGRIMGANSTFEMLRNFDFSTNGLSKSIAALLTMSSLGTRESVSRSVFFNTRTDSMDRLSSVPRLVVADGDYSFLRVLDNPLFQTADIIGIVDRTVDRDRLENISSRLSTLRNWYGLDEQLPEKLPELVRGIDIGIVFKSLTK